MKPLGKIAVFIILFAIALTACAQGVKPAELVAATATQIPTQTATASTTPTLTPLNQVESEISQLLLDLERRGFMTELDQDGDRVIWTLVQDTGNERVGVFVSDGDRFRFRMSQNLETPSFPLGNLVLDDEIGELLVTDDSGFTIFEFNQGFKWVQVRDLPYLMETAGKVVLVVGDSFRRNDGSGVKNIVVNADFPSRPFDDPETGERVFLTPEERLSLASEVAEVLAAQALDPDYSFSDLREGKQYVIQDLKRRLYQVDPSKTFAFYLTARKPPAEFYVYENIDNKMMFWWEAGVDGSLRLYVSYDLDDPILSYGGNVDILYRKALLTMLLAQYVEPGERINSAYESYKDLLPNEASRELSQLLVALVHEIDNAKLAERQVKVGTLEIGLEPGINFNVDLFFTER